MTQEQKYHRYVATTTMSKILGGLDPNHVMLLKAQRTWQEQAIKVTPPVSYIDLRKRLDAHVEVDYHRRVNGQFDKEMMLEFLEQSGAQDMSIDQLDILVPPELKLGEKYSKLDERYNTYRGEKFVARFEKYPSHRDGEKNEFTEHLDDWWDKPSTLESELGFAKSSLDFQYAVPLPRWLEITRGVLSQRYRDDIANWIEFHQVDARQSIRDVVKHLFPKDMSSGRIYTRVRGKGEWKLTSQGDF